MIRINKIRNIDNHNRYFKYVSLNRIICSNVENKIFFLNYYKYGIIVIAGHPGNKIKYIENIDKWFGMVCC